MHANDDYVSEAEDDLPWCGGSRLAVLGLLVGLGQHLARLLDPLADRVRAAAPLLAEVHRAHLQLHALGDDLVALGRREVLGVGGIGGTPSVRDPILQGK